MQLVIHMIYILGSPTQLACCPGMSRPSSMASMRQFVEVSFTSKNWRLPVLQLKESIRTAATLLRLSQTCWLVIRPVIRPVWLVLFWLEPFDLPKNMTILDRRNVLSWSSSSTGNRGLSVRSREKRPVPMEADLKQWLPHIPPFASPKRSHPWGLRCLTPFKTKFSLILFLLKVWPDPVHMGIPSFQGSSEQLFPEKLSGNRGIVSLPDVEWAFILIRVVSIIFFTLSCMAAGLSDCWYHFLTGRPT